MIKAVIFDCFGVLTNDGWLAFKNRYLSQDKALEDEAIELNKRADARLMTQEEFEHELARLANVDIAEVRRVIDTHAPNDALFDYIAMDLKPHYKIGLLSNVAADYMSELFSQQQNAVFDARVFSFELGVTKPHPAMYETIATRLGMLPEECVFIDDRQGFVEGAKQTGMYAFQFIDNDQCRRELSALLGEASAGTARG